MANTPFLDLVKPAGTDRALVSVINSNSDKIDGGVSTISEQIQHYYDTDGKLYRLPSNADLDSITESGRYYFGSNVTNKPASGGGYLDVYAYDTSWIKQVAYLEGSDAIYVRTKTGSSWSAWKQLAAGTEFNTVAISTLSALQTYLDNMPVGKTSTLILSGEASNAVCGSTYISNATVTKIDNSFADLRWSRANEDAGFARYQKTSQTFRLKHHANVIELQKTSVSVGQKSSWDSVYSEIENGYAGIVIIHFQNGANITGLVYKNNASYGSILGTTDDDSNPYFYAVKNGTSALRRLAYST